MIDEAKDKLERLVTTAHNALYQFGMTRDELHRLVREALERSRSTGYRQQ
jgi:ribosome modulation factor